MHNYLGPTFNLAAENIDEEFTFLVADYFGLIGDKRNVELSAADIARLSELISDHIEPDLPLRFLRHDRQAGSKVIEQICIELDTLMTYRFADLYAATFGGHMLRHGYNQMRRVILHLLPFDAGNGRVQWPKVDVAALEPHLQRRAEALLATWPQGEKTFAHFRGFLLDRPSAEGPALTFVLPGLDGEEYWCDGVLERDPHEGPARTIRFTDGWKRREEHYCANNVLHRDNGPAVVVYGLNDEPIEDIFLQHGTCVDWCAADAEVP